MIPFSSVTTDLQQDGISFCIAAYNVENYLERCVKSIQSQTLDNIEIIILNDKSTDSTLSIAEKLCDADPKLRTKCISHIKNLGLPAARNTAFFAATKKYIWHIDADDYLINERAAENIFNALERSGTNIIKFNVLRKVNWHLEGEGAEYYKKIVSDSINLSYTIVDSTEILKKFGLGGAFSIVYNRELANYYGIHNLEGVSIGEDQILLVQLVSNFNSIALSEQCQYVYDNTGPSMMRTTWGIEKFLEDRIYINFIYDYCGSKKWLREFAGCHRFIYTYTEMQEKCGDLCHKDLETLIQYLWLYDLSRMNITLQTLKKQLSWGNYSYITTDVFKKIEKKYTAASKIIPNFSELFDLLLKKSLINICIGVQFSEIDCVDKYISLNEQNLAIEGTYKVSLSIPLRSVENYDVDLFKTEVMRLLVINLYRVPKKLIILVNVVPEDFQVFNNENFNIIASHAKIMDVLTNVFETKEFNVSYKAIIDSSSLESLNRICSHGLKKHDAEAISRQLVKVKNSTTEFNIISVNRENFSRFVAILIGQVHKCLFSNYLDLCFYYPTPDAITSKIMSKASGLDQKSADKLYTKCLGRVLQIHWNNRAFSDIFYRHEIFTNTCHAFQHIDQHSLKTKTYQEFCAPISKFVFMSYYQNKLYGLQKNLDKTFNNKIFYSFDYPRILRNVENIEEYNCRNLSYVSKKVGISAMLRVKNEATNIERVLKTCCTLFDEIVLIDNQSTDNTVDLALKCQKTIPNGDRIKIYDYPFDVARCGSDNFNCPEDSVHSLAYFYNYSKSKCSYSHIFKWDGDMFVTNNMLIKLQALLHEISANTVSLKRSRTIGITRGITVYQGKNGLKYYKKDEVEQEIRLFPNTVEFIFVKDVNWETLSFTCPVEKLISSEPVFIEFKDAALNEFSHWNTERLNMNQRDARIFSNYKYISKLGHEDTHIPEGYAVLTDELY